mmetsp:Transcript_4047/g.15095  ORF Transcript_4047/g.15095 Transcript_4047/m.15095 type:complete len:211 (-) Transcript_4047:611-1243(-)
MPVNGWRTEMLRPSIRSLRASRSGLVASGRASTCRLTSSIAGDKDWRTKLLKSSVCNFRAIKSGLMASTTDCWSFRAPAAMCPSRSASACWVVPAFTCWVVPMSATSDRSTCSADNTSATPAVTCWAAPLSATSERNACRADSTSAKSCRARSLASSWSVWTSTRMLSRPARAAAPHANCSATLQEAEVASPALAPQLSEASLTKSALIC